MHTAFLTAGILVASFGLGFMTRQIMRHQVSNRALIFGSVLVAVAAVLMLMGR